MENCFINTENKYELSEYTTTVYKENFTAEREIVDLSSSPKGKKGVYQINFKVPQVIMNSSVWVDTVFVYQTNIGIFLYTYDKYGNIYVFHKRSGWGVCPHKAPRQVRQVRDKNKGGIISPHSLGYAIEAYRNGQYEGVIQPPLSPRILKKYEKEIRWLLRQAHQGICLVSSASTLAVLQGICNAEAWGGKNE